MVVDGVFCIRNSSTEGAIGSSLLPPAPQNFFGRQDTVDEVVKTITTQEPARVVVLGAGGIGKVRFHHLGFDCTISYVIWMQDIPESRRATPSDNCGII